MTPRIAACWLDLAATHTGSRLDRALLRRVTGREYPTPPTVIGSQVHAALRRLTTGGAAAHAAALESGSIGPLASCPQVINSLSAYVADGEAERQDERLVYDDDPLLAAVNHRREPSADPLCTLVGRCDLLHRDGFIVDFKTQAAGSSKREIAARAEARQLDAYRALFGWQPIRVMVLLVDYDRRLLVRTVEARPSHETPTEASDRLVDSIRTIRAALLRLVAAGELEILDNGRHRATEQLELFPA